MQGEGKGEEARAERGGESEERSEERGLALLSRWSDRIAGATRTCEYNRSNCCLEIQTRLAEVEGEKRKRVAAAARLFEALLRPDMLSFVADHSNFRTTALLKLEELRQDAGYFGELNNSS